MAKLRPENTWLYLPVGETIFFKEERPKYVLVGVVTQWQQLPASERALFPVGVADKPVPRFESVNYSEKIILGV